LNNGLLLHILADLSRLCTNKLSKKKCAILHPKNHLTKVSFCDTIGAVIRQVPYKMGTFLIHKNFMLNKRKNTIKQVIISALAVLIMLPMPVHAKSISINFSKTFSILSAQNLIDYSFTVHNIITRYKDFERENELRKMEEIKDAEQARKIDEYFEKRDMPLAGYGKEFVEAAKKYNIDPRLLPAIGVRESSGGKRLMNNNPFGWGSAEIPFEDFSDAIDVVSMNLGGYNPGTARYYKDADTEKKLWYYNGSVIPSYTQEVLDIMELMS
jgi:hypothetical protein